VPIEQNAILPAKAQFLLKIKPATAQKLLTRASGCATVAQGEAPSTNLHLDASPYRIAVTPLCCFILSTCSLSVVLGI